ncbi:uncharacterized protein LOC112451871 [Temnothorax curvispinosus]|uniref:Uncharacterized protein LOC112451871 n=1 Tax=Temnothorax curvispinosus TaxID=300111 RepID=A0A6J1PDE3_9HYME|nr:uncharacterized protein LOC112451871 [Temnothorax curvispinosus]
MPVAAKISLQINHFTYIKSVALEAKESGFFSLPLASLKVKLSLIDNYWEKFDQEHERLSDLKVDSLLELDYFRDGVYDQYYAEVKATLAYLIEEKDRSSSFLGSKLTNLSLPGPSTARSHLPEISLPQFDGDFSAWRPFHDLFSSLVGRVHDISNVEKMHYLRTSLTGEAAQLISNLPVAEDSFAAAWDLLVERFENKRLLISSQVERLFAIKAMAARSARELNAVLNTTTEALNAL